MARVSVKCIVKQFKLTVGSGPPRWYSFVYTIYTYIKEKRQVVVTFFSLSLIASLGG